MCFKTYRDKNNKNITNTLQSWALGDNWDFLNHFFGFCYRDFEGGIIRNNARAKFQIQECKIN